MSLLELLDKYCSGGAVPMHMPGHKRNTDLFKMANPYGLDITEIDGFDNLHDPKGILLESMQKASSWYGSAKTWYLVNGSSTGILAAVLALTERRSAVLTARNCHISVYNAIYENELYPVYTYPKFVDNLWISQGILPEDVEKSLFVNKVDNGNNSEVKKISAVIITSPTYEGNISDIKSIAGIAHSYNIPLIVDEAHGAHFRYSQDFPESALELGADVVVQSIHKTLPAFTQTALLHVGKNALERERYIRRLDRYINIFQTTSPSYILMASADHCLELMNSSAGKDLTDDYTVRLKQLRNSIERLSLIKLAVSDDISKLVIYTENGCLQGKQLYDILLEQYDIQPEMASYRYVILMTSVADKQEYYDRLIAALTDIDSKIAGLNGAGASGAKPVFGGADILCRNEIRLRPYDAMNGECEEIPCLQSAGRISASYVCVYPPGIPLICPGEIISGEAVTAIEESCRQGLEVIGLTGGKEHDERKIQCLK